MTICGNVLTAPEWRRTRNTKALVANFRVASTSRRFDRASGDWVDGDSLRVRVNCWRRLAEGVAASVMVGDPVVVVGRLYSRDWTTENNERRVAYELEAVAVGHDLAKGRATFERRRPTTATSAVEDEEAENRVGGEPSDRVVELSSARLAERTGAGVGGAFGSEAADDLEVFPALTDAEVEALGVLNSAGLETTVPGLTAAHTGDTTSASTTLAVGRGRASGPAPMPTPTMPAAVSRVENGGVAPDRHGGESELGDRPDAGNGPVVGELATDENPVGHTAAEVKTLGRRRGRDRQPVPA